MPRKFITTAAFLAEGRSRHELYWLVKKGRLVKVDNGVFTEPNGEELTPLDFAVARTLASGQVAAGLLGGALYELDAIEPAQLTLPSRRRTVMFGGPPRTINGVPVAHPLQVMVELAAMLDDLAWEQALESALRKKLVTVDDFVNLLPELSGSRTHGGPRIRRVLRLRPSGAPPTGSMLETRMVQLARRTDGVPEPDRQTVVNDEDGQFVARVDLAWVDLGAFNELDGMGHKGQPVYDASRETSVVATTGWLCGRFTWREVTDTPITTARKLLRFLDRARRRPMAS